MKKYGLSVVLFNRQNQTNQEGNILFHVYDYTIS